MPKMTTGYYWVYIGEEEAWNIVWVDMEFESVCFLERKEKERISWLLNKSTAELLEVGHFPFCDQAVTKED